MNPGAAATRAKAALKAAAAGKAQWAVAFDAGSSGTRVYIYNFTGVSALWDKGAGLVGGWGGREGCRGWPRRERGTRVYNFTGVSAIGDKGQQE